MRLCVGTAKGIVILDPQRGGAPCMISADPPSVWCLAQDCSNPRLLYAGSIHNNQAGSARGKSAIAISEDGGRIWRDITPGSIRDEEVWALATPPDRHGEVFVGTSHARLFRSDDGGRTLRENAAFAKLPGRDHWSSARPPHVPRVRCISFDPNDSNTLYVAVEQEGLFRSRDRGISFEPLDQNINADIHCIAADPDNSARLYATTGEGIYLSANNGASWMQARGLSRSYTVPMLLRRNVDGLIYTAAAGGPPATWTMDQLGADALLFRSEDRGSSFKPIAYADGMPHPMRGMIMRLIADRDDDHVLFGALSDGGIIKLDERDETVSLVAEKLPPAYDLAVLP